MRAITYQAAARKARRINLAQAAKLPLLAPILPQATADEVFASEQKRQAAIAAMTATAKERYTRRADRYLARAAWMHEQLLPILGADRLVEIDRAFPRALDGQAEYIADHWSQAYRAAMADTIGPAIGKPAAEVTTLDAQRYAERQGMPRHEVSA